MRPHSKTRIEAHLAKLEERGSKPVQTCSVSAEKHELCWRITAMLGAREHGFGVLWTYKPSRAEPRFLGIVYRLTPSDTGVMLNFCPFCGKSVEVPG